MKVSVSKSVLISLIFLLSIGFTQQDDVKWSQIQTQNMYKGDKVEINLASYLPVQNIQSFEVTTGGDKGLKVTQPFQADQTQKVALVDQGCTVAVPGYIRRSFVAICNDSHINWMSFDLEDKVVKTNSYEILGGYKCATLASTGLNIDPRGKIQKNQNRIFVGCHKPKPEAPATILYQVFALRYDLIEEKLQLVSQMAADFEQPEGHDIGQNYAISVSVSNSGTSIVLGNLHDSTFDGWLIPFNLADFYGTPAWFDPKTLLQLPDLNIIDAIMFNKRIFFISMATKDDRDIYTLLMTGVPNYDPDTKEIDMLNMTTVKNPVIFSGLTGKTGPVKVSISPSSVTLSTSKIIITSGKSVKAGYIQSNNGQFNLKTNTQHYSLGDNYSILRSYWFGDRLLVLSNNKDTGNQLHVVNNSNDATYLIDFGATDPNVIFSQSSNIFIEQSFYEKNKLILVAVGPNDMVYNKLSQPLGILTPSAVQGPDDIVKPTYKIKATYLDSDNKPAVVESDSFFANVLTKFNGNYSISQKQCSTVGFTKAMIHFPLYQSDFFGNAPNYTWKQTTPTNSLFQKRQLSGAPKLLLKYLNQVDATFDDKSQAITGILQMMTLNQGRFLIRTEKIVYIVACSHGTKPSGLTTSCSVKVQWNVSDIVLDATAYTLVTITAAKYSHNIYLLVVSIDDIPDPTVSTDNLTQKKKIYKSCYSLMKDDGTKAHVGAVKYQSVLADIRIDNGDAFVIFSGIRKFSNLKKYVLSYTKIQLDQPSKYPSGGEFNYKFVSWTPMKLRFLPKMSTGFVALSQTAPGIQTIFHFNIDDLRSPAFSLRLVASYNLNDQFKSPTFCLGTDYIHIIDQQAPDSMYQLVSVKSDLTGAKNYMHDISSYDGAKYIKGVACDEEKGTLTIVATNQKDAVSQPTATYLINLHGYLSDSPSKRVHSVTKLTYPVSSILSVYDEATDSSMVLLIKNDNQGNLSLKDGMGFSVFYPGPIIDLSTYDSQPATKKLDFSLTATPSTDPQGKTAQIALAAKLGDPTLNGSISLIESKKFALAENGAKATIYLENVFQFANPILEINLKAKITDDSGNKIHQRIRDSKSFLSAIKYGSDADPIVGFKKVKNYAVVWTKKKLNIFKEGQTAPLLKPDFIGQALRVDFSLDNDGSPFCFVYQLNNNKIPTSFYHNVGIIYSITKDDKFVFKFLQNIEQGAISPHFSKAIQVANQYLMVSINNTQKPQVNILGLMFRKGTLVPGSVSHRFIFDQDVTDITVASLSNSLIIAGLVGTKKGIWFSAIAPNSQIGSWEVIGSGIFPLLKEEHSTDHYLGRISCEGNNNTTEPKSVECVLATVNSFSYSLKIQFNKFADVKAKGVALVNVDSPNTGWTHSYQNPVNFRPSSIQSCKEYVVMTMTKNSDAPSLKLSPYSSKNLVLVYKKPESKTKTQNIPLNSVFTPEQFKLQEFNFSEISVHLDSTPSDAGGNNLQLSLNVAGSLKVFSIKKFELELQDESKLNLSFDSLEILDLTGTPTTVKLSQLFAMTKKKSNWILWIGGIVVIALLGVGIGLMVSKKGDDEEEDEEYKNDIRASLRTGDYKKEKSVGDITKTESEFSEL